MFEFTYLELFILISIVELVGIVVGMALAVVWIKRNCPEADRLITEEIQDR